MRFYLLIIISIFINANNGWSKLHKYIYKEDLIKVESILKAEPNLINKKSNFGISPLHLAIKVRNLEIVKLLIKYKVDINIQDKSGLSALHYSIAKNLNRISKFLITSGINIEIVTLCLM